MLTGKVNWNVSANVSVNRNKVVSMGGLDDIISTTERSVGSHITKEGYPIGSFYGYNAIGIMSKADYANALLDREVYLKNGNKFPEGYELKGPAVSSYSLDALSYGNAIWEDVNGDGLITTDARRDELRLGRGELPPHRLLRRGDGQGLRQAVFHDGDAHAAGRHGAFGGREGHHRARADVQHAGDALGAGRRHECHAGRRRFGDVPHPLGGRLSGDGSGVRRRSRRHVQRHKTSTDLSVSTARIDYIYTRGQLSLKTYKVDNSIYEGIYPSDHCPVTIQVDFDYDAPEAPEIEGSGTASDPWKISSRPHWNAVAESSTPVRPTPSTLDGLLRLSSRHVSRVRRVPVSFETGSLVYFGGVFDGKGHTIRNVKTTASGESFGLFGGNEGTIKDLAVENLALSTAFKTAGGVVGTNRGVIDGVTFRGEIVGSGKAAVLGGIAGQNQGVIINCGNRGGKIEAVELDKGAKGENLGGIAGQISKGSDGKGQLYRQLLQLDRAGRFEQQHRRYRRHRQRRQFRRQLLFDAGRRLPERFVRLVGGLQQEGQRTERLR